MSQNERFEWQKSPEGLWRREIDECEQFYRLYTKKELGCYPITGCASFKLQEATGSQFEIGEKALKSAWTFLRHKHPTLGSCIERHDKSDKWERVYKPFESEEDIECWLNTTFKVINTDKSALSWFNDDAPSFTMPTVYLVESDLDDQHTLFLRCPHDITDGVGILQLVNQLFDGAARFHGDSEEFNYPLPEINLGTRLSPSLRVAASIPSSLSEAQEQHLEEIQAFNEKVYNHAGLMSLPTSSSLTTTSNVRMKRIVLSASKDLSSKVLAGCKRISPGVSLTHVFISAMTMALCDLQPRKADSYTARYVDRPMINIRPYCRDPFNTSQHAASAYHAVATYALGIDVKVPSLADEGSNSEILKELAIRVRDLYQQLKPESSNDTYEQALFAPSVFQSLFPPPSVDPWAIQESPFCPVSLSSIGNIAKIVEPSNGAFELSKVWVVSQPISAGVAIFLTSWDGQIELSSVFNTQYHNEGYVKGFLDKIMNHVFQGLGIEKKAYSITAAK
ncbi:hypothetical protein ACLX1H_004743 [Fusarium chlamydosporum]